MMKSNRSALRISACLAVLGASAFLALGQHEPPAKATGIVYEDRNASGRFDQGDRPLKDMRVSNGTSVVLTDEQGRYELPVKGDGEIFVIKPRDYELPLNKYNLPQFYYLHRPNGSPEMQHAGIPPTGPLPESVDFPLVPKAEPNEFDVIVFGDPQPRNIQEVQFVIRDAVEELISERVHKRSAFGISLGDIAFNDLNTFEPLNAGVAQLGLPWINVIGNHDCNFDAPHLEQSFETFQRVYGPHTWAFDFGPAHFIVLNSVLPHKENGRFGYRGGLTASQLEFIANDLKHVPKQKLIVFLMHIPFVVENGKALFDIVKDRSHTVSLSSHTHNHQHHFLGRKAGWQGETPHHHINHGAVCGSWWRGIRDEYDIPDATMTDGTPNGYGILTITGNTYHHRYKVLRRSPEFQMHIDAPEVIAANASEPITISANIFNAWPEAAVKMRIAQGPWKPLQRARGQHDPVYSAHHSKNQELARQMGSGVSAPKVCSHLWTGQLEEELAEGSHLIEIETRNPDGQVFRGARVFRVERTVVAAQ